MAQRQRQFYGSVIEKMRQPIHNGVVIPKYKYKKPHIFVKGKKG